MKMNTHKIKIKLNEQYGIFKQGFEIELEGNLIILSGTNGSGKSQLADILYQKPIPPPRPQRTDVVEVNGIRVHHDAVTRVNIEKSSSIANQSSTLTSDKIWELIREHTRGGKKLPPSSYHNSYIELIDRLEKLYPGVQPQDYTTKQIEKALLANPVMIFKEDDVFGNYLSQHFHAYAARVVMAQSEASKRGIEPTLSNLGDKPWGTLNRMLGILNVRYRFKDDFECILVHSQLRLNSAPLLYACDASGVIQTKEPREFRDLSGGEKTLLQLAFAKTYDLDGRAKKIIILDEYDATLNASLTSAFYSILNELFIEKGIVVIVITHSLATISLAPDDTSFYEVFKPDDFGSSPKILQVSGYNYTDMSEVNNRYIQDIQQSEQRIKVLKEEATVANEIKQSTKPILFVEDKVIGIYQVAYLKNKDVEFKEDNLDETFQKESPFEIISKNGKDQLYGMFNAAKMDEFKSKPILALFDFDEAFKNFERLKKENGWGKTQGSDTEGWFRERSDVKTVKAMVLPVPSHRKMYAAKDQKYQALCIERYFDESVLKRILPGASKENIFGSLEVINVSKTRKNNFYKKTIELDKECFKSFEELFKRVEQLLEI